MGKVNEHSAWGGSAYNSDCGVARSSPERGGVLGAVDCTAFYFKYHLHLHAVPVEGRGADSLTPQPRLRDRESVGGRERKESKILLQLTSGPQLHYMYALG